MSYSPWGVIQHENEYAEGIKRVHTAGHGGIKLDRKRNAMMPEAFRIAGGWYEEDCEWALVALVFPAVFDKQQDVAHKTVKDTFPYKYEQHFGVVVPLEESYTKREDQFYIDNANNWVCTSCNLCKADASLVECLCVLGKDTGLSFSAATSHTVTRKTFLVPCAEYQTRSIFFVIDPLRHKEVSGGL